MISSEHIKCALMAYYRFVRHYACADEVYSGCREIADILVDTGSSFYEIEIKTSKSDLCAEKKKSKHKAWKGDHRFFKTTGGANYFYICVPEELHEYALKWVNEMNPKYGLIIYKEVVTKWKSLPIWEKCVRIEKKARKLHKEYNKGLKERMLLRLSSALANAYQSIMHQRTDQCKTDSTELTTKESVQDSLLKTDE